VGVGLGVTEGTKVGVGDCEGMGVILILFHGFQ
jgi:hypothetical protein